MACWAAGHVLVAFTCLEARLVQFFLPASYLEPALHPAAVSITGNITDSFSAARLHWPSNFLFVRVPVCTRHNSTYSWVLLVSNVGYWGKGAVIQPFGVHMFFASVCNVQLFTTLGSFISNHSVVQSESYTYSTQWYCTVSPVTTRIILLMLIVRCTYIEPIKNELHVKQKLF